MANRITPEQIQEMVRLYAEIGTYSGVAKQMGVSASTVSRYVKEQKSIKTYEAPTAEGDIPQPKPISEISRDSIITFSTLTPEEKESYAAWIKEFE